ncbi:MAG: ABC transporter substrate-binding protein [Fastidiosipila sp.]|jgi:NitT/TauT family transport system substrate-binding protein|nr:ABC transporter substrate-binding protein [Fastidiosipila sp.]
MKKTILAMVCLLQVLISVLALFACGKEKKQKVTVNYSKGNYVAATSIIIRHEGLFEKYLPSDVTVEWVNIQTGPEIRDAMLTGTIDIASPALITTITSLENGIPFRLISFSSSTPTKLYARDEFIKSIHDLDPSMRISLTNLSTNLHISFLAYCQEVLGDSNALADALVSMPNAEALAALTSGSGIDASIFTFSTNMKAESEESLHMIADMTDVTREYGIGSAYIVTESFYKENPDIISAFIKAQNEAVSLILSRPDYAANILIEEGLDTDSDTLVKVIAEMPPSPRLTPDMFNRQAMLLFNAGILSKEPRKLEDYDFFEALRQH